jgi:NAD dependent epimerase/dehydratase family enzyme
LCRIYLQAVEDSRMNGAYNAVSPHHVSHKEFMRTLADTMNRQVLFPPVPGFILRSLLGEMSDVILKGSRLSSEKILQTGFCFEFTLLKDALRDVLEGN